MTLDLQALTMLHMLGAGIYLGLGYDTYARLRVKKHRWLTIIQDLLFWLLSGMVVFLWLQAVNAGEMRVYVFLSMFCGYAAYKALFQHWYKKALEALIKSIVACYRLIHWLLCVLIIIPLMWIYRIILAILVFTFGQLSSIGTYFYRFLRMLVKPIWRRVVVLWSRLWHRMNNRTPPADPSENDQRRGKNEPLDSEGFLKRLANWLYKGKE